MNPMQATVYVVDDDPSVRAGLSRLLQSVGLTVKTFTSAREFLDQVVAGEPGCVIADLRMPAMSGLELQEQLMTRNLNLPVIFLTGYGTVPASVRAMKRGAADFLEKPVDDQVLLDAIFQALEKDRKNSRNQAEVKFIQDRLKSLTPREYEVFTLITVGQLNKQVAYELGTGEKTIKIHRARIMKKMHCESLAQLVRLSEKAGIR
jgi:FixJ family two-component response regulator